MLLQARINNIWVDLPTPSPEFYDPTYQHLEDSFIDARGFLHRDIVRLNRAKVECGWNALTGEQNALLQSLYSFKSFRMRYTDNFNNRVEKTMYAGPLTGKTYKLENLEIKLKTQVQMNFIEV